jgi:hypothetical protein
LGTFVLSPLFLNEIKKTIMAFVPDFVAIQPFGTPNLIEITDLSTGSDSRIVTRRIYVRKADGSAIVDGEIWDYPDMAISLDVLTKDIACEVTVEWLDGTPTPTYDPIVLYNKVIMYGFTEYSEMFDYGLTQMLTANPLLINDNDYFPHKSDLRTSIDSGNQAIIYAQDLFAAQQCYDRATNLRLNSQYYFNINS